jgi:hypothetical protein
MVKDHFGHESDQLYLHSRCHIKAPTWAVIEYAFKPDGTYLRVECSECKALVVRFKLDHQVAEGT